MKFYRFIIPINDHFFIARLDETKAEGHKYRNFGQAELLNNQYIGDISIKFIFVVEGAFDALAIEEWGFNSFALNSTANASLLVKELRLNENVVTLQQFILLADNDNAGKALEENLQKSFEDMNMYLHIAKWYDNLQDIKDFSELSSRNPGKAEATLKTAIVECIKLSLLS